MRYWVEKVVWPALLYAAFGFIVAVALFGLAQRSKAAGISMPPVAEGASMPRAGLFFARLGPDREPAGTTQGGGANHGGRCALIGVIASDGIRELYPLSALLGSSPAFPAARRTRCFRTETEAIEAGWPPLDEFEAQGVRAR